MLLRINLFVLLIASVLCFLAVIEVGFRLGRREKELRDDGTGAHVGALQTALLGLLALLLGFTFAMSVSRFEIRKALVAEEANAIGATFIRARLLPEPHRQGVRHLLNEYVAARLAFNEDRDERALMAAEAATFRMQRELWAHTVGAAAQEPTSEPVALFIQSVNEAIDKREAIRAARDNYVPETVLFLLFAVTAVSLAFIGYGSGLTGRRRFVPNAVFALLIALVLTIILDLDRPRRGLIRVSQGSMIRLKAKMDQSQP